MRNAMATKQSFFVGNDLRVNKKIREKVVMNMTHIDALSGETDS